MSPLRRICLFRDLARACARTLASGHSLRSRGCRFYYLVESEGSPSSDPLIWCGRGVQPPYGHGDSAPPAQRHACRWMNGGPGASSLVGLFAENGPLLLNEANELVPNPYSWNKMARAAALPRAHRLCQCAPRFLAGWLPYSAPTAAGERAVRRVLRGRRILVLRQLVQDGRTVRAGVGPFRGSGSPAQMGTPNPIRGPQCPVLPTPSTTCPHNPTSCRALPLTMSPATGWLSGRRRSHGGRCSGGWKLLSLPLIGHNVGKSR